MSTKLWAVRDALVTAFGVVDADVFAGPRPKSANPKRYVLVGSDGGETGVESTEDGLTAEQTASALGPGTWRDETGSILCAVWAWSGNSSVTTDETDARVLFDACEDALAADRSLAGLLIAGGLAELASISVRESLLRSGPYVRISFGVNYGALITS